MPQFSGQASIRNKFQASQSYKVRLSKENNNKKKQNETKNANKFLFKTATPFVSFQFNTGNTSIILFYSVSMPWTPTELFTNSYSIPCFKINDDIHHQFLSKQCSVKFNLYCSEDILQHRK